MLHGLILSVQMTVSCHYLYFQPGTHFYAWVGEESLIESPRFGVCLIRESRLSGDVQLYLIGESGGFGESPISTTSGGGGLWRVTSSTVFLHRRVPKSMVSI